MEDQHALAVFDRVIDLARKGNPEKTIEFVRNNGRRIAFEIVEERNLEGLTSIEKQMLLSRAIELLIALSDFSTYLVEREKARKEKLTANERNRETNARLDFAWTHDNEFAQLPLSNMATGLAYLVRGLIEEVGDERTEIRARRAVEKLRETPLIHHMCGIGAIEESITRRLGELKRMREIGVKTENRAIEVKKLPR